MKPIQLWTNLLASSAGLAVGISFLIFVTYAIHLTKRTNALALHISMISFSYGLISFVLAWLIVKAIRARGFIEFGWEAWTLLIAYLIGDIALVLILWFMRKRQHLQKHGRRRTDDATGGDLDDSG